MKSSNLLKLREYQSPETTNCLVGHIVSLGKDGHVLVDYPGNHLGPVTARSTVSQPLEDTSDNIPVLIILENGDPALPIIVGVVRDTLPLNSEVRKVGFEIETHHEIFIDGKKIVFEAAEQIELRCGKSSVILTKEGRVVLKGTEIVSRASRTNKIKGASVSIN